MYPVTANRLIIRDRNDRAGLLRSSAKLISSLISDDPFPNHKLALVPMFPGSGVGYLREVPMSRIRAGFHFAEILMLTASILVVAAISLCSEITLIGTRIDS